MSPISDKEWDIVVHDLMERLKDWTYLRLEDEIRTALQPWRDQILGKPSDEPILIRFDYRLVAGDIHQIVGRERRKSERVPGKP